LAIPKPRAQMILPRSAMAGDIPGIPNCSLIAARSLCIVKTGLAKMPEPRRAVQAVRRVGKRRLITARARVGRPTVLRTWNRRICDFLTPRVSMLIESASIRRRLRLARSMQLGAKNNGDGDHPIAGWKLPSLPDTAWFEPVSDSAYPWRGCREYGPRENRKRNHGPSVADAPRSAESRGPA
jgi:hypothetical protein